jgi:hypothetical protein
VRLVPDVAATAFEPPVATGVAVTSGLGESSAPIGDGEAVEGGAGE